MLILLLLWISETCKLSKLSFSLLCDRSIQNIEVVKGSAVQEKINSSAS